MSGKWEFRKFINFIAFFAMIFAAISYTVGRFIPAAAAFLLPIANFLAFAVATVSAFYYARSKRNAVWIILWVLATVVVLSLLFLSAIGR